MVEKVQWSQLGGGIPAGFCLTHTVGEGFVKGKILDSEVIGERREGTEKESELAGMEVEEGETGTTGAREGGQQWRRAASTPAQLRVKLYDSRRLGVATVREGGGEAGSRVVDSW